ncbi:MAG: hypothetical protein HY275_09575 [Gemmatimonadetes bacterium]|nr:hypothetical protein [Gemmatimonadota bacterium]
MSRVPTPLARRAAAVLVAMLGLSCAEQLTFTAAVATSATSVNAGGGLSATVGTVANPSPGVKVLDQKGNPMPGVPVTFTATATDGTVSGTTVRTGSDGIALVGSWTPPTIAGTDQTGADVTLGSGVQRVTLALKARPDLPDTLLLLSGAGQTAIVGATLGTPLAVLVRDKYGNAVPGVPVTFSAGSSGATFNGATSVSVPTDSTGVARAPAWKLGVTAGSQPVTISVPGATIRGGPVQLAATATPAGPKQILVNGGSGQQAPVGTVVAVPPSVVVKDSLGNAVPGVPVTFTSFPGNGTITGGSATTDSLGVARVGSWTLAATPGVDTLVARIGITTTTVNITALAVGPPAKLAFSWTPGVNIRNGVLVPSPKVVVQDAFGTTLVGATNAVTVGIATSPSPTTLAGTVTRAAAAGTATFNDLAIPLAGNGFSLIASATGLASATSATFTLNPYGGLKALQFAVQPTSSATTVAIAPAVQVQLLDSLGNAVATAGTAVTVAFGANPGSATLGGTLSATTSASGIATFGNLTVSAAGSGYTLVATSGAVTQASAPFDVRAPGAPAKLKFVTQPAATMTAGLAIAPTLQVVVQDNTGLTVPTATNAIGVSLAANTAAGAVVTGIVAVNAAGGAAAFSNVRVRKAGSGYRLVASATGLAPDTTTVFAVTPAPASTLAWTTQPPATVAPGARIAPPLTLDVLDSTGNRVTSSTDSVQLAFGTAAAGQVLSGRSGARAIAGVVTLDSVVVGSVIASQTLTARHVPTGATVASNAFAVATGPAAKLKITVQPTATLVSGASFAPGVVVAVQDAAGLTVPTASNTVTVSLATNGAGATASGTTSLAATAGVATFSALKVTKVGTGYQLVVAASGLTPDTSTVFAVTPGAPATVAWVTQPPASVQDGVAIAPPLVLNVLDAQGNVLPTSTDSVALSTSLTAGQSLTGRLGARAVAGVVTLDSVVVGGVIASRTLSAQLVSTGAVTPSTAFAVTAGPPFRLKFTTQPQAVENQGVTLTSLGVQSRDLAGNVIASDTASVTVSLIGGLSGATLGGTTLKPLVSGATSFGNLTVSRMGNLYRVVVSRAGMLPDTTVPFRIVGPAYRVKLTSAPTGAIRGGGFSVSMQIQDSLGFPRNAGTVGTSVTMIGGTLGAVLGGTTSGSATAATGAASSPSGATLTGLTVNLAGAGYQMVASASGLVSDTSAAFAVAANDVPARVRVVQQPPVVSATGSILTPAITVAVQDSVGNPVPTATNAVTMSINPNPGGATLGGTPTVAAVAGVATFADLSLSAAGSGYKLRASATGLALDSSAAFSIVGASAPCKLAFVQQPQSITAGAVMPLGVQVQVQTCAGAPVSSTTPVTLAVGNNPTGLAPGLSGAGPVAAVAGTATFNATTLTRSGVGYTLTASAPGLIGASSAAFDVTSGAASRVIWIDSLLPVLEVGQPYPAGTVVRLAVADGFGNVVTSASNVFGVTWFGQLAQPGTAWQGPPLVATGWSTSNGTATTCLDPTGGAYGKSGGAAGPNLAAVNGVVTYDLSGLRVRLLNVGFFRFTASGIGGLTDLVPSFTAAPAAGLAWSVGVQQGCLGGGSGLVANQTLYSPLGGFTYAPIAFVVDSLGNVAAPSSPVVTVSLQSGALGSLTGVTTKAATTSVDFTGIAITKGGTFNLVATAPGLASATSPPIVIADFGAATALRFLTQPPNGSLGAALIPAPQVAVLDAFGNTVTNNSSASITLALASNPGSATLTGGGPVTAVNGVATFPAVNLSAAATGYTLLATATGLTGITSSAFNIVDPNPPASLSFTTQPPTTVTAGSILAPLPVVAIIGSLGTKNSFATNSVTIAVDSGPTGALALQGTLTKPAVAGSVTFNDLVLRTAGTYRLRASATGLSVGLSAYVTVSPSVATSPVFIDPMPTVVTAGDAFPAFRVGIQDAYGNRLTNSGATATLNGPGTGNYYLTYGRLGGPYDGTPAYVGTLTATLVNGVATFTGVRGRLAVDTAQWLVNVSGLSPSAVSSMFKVTAAPAVRLGPARRAQYLAYLGYYYYYGPALTFPNLIANQATQFYVTVIDSIGNVARVPGVTISVGVQGGSPAATLLGATVGVTDANGGADFGNVAVSGVGTGYSIRATDLSGQLAPSLSGTFSTTTDVAARLFFRVQPSTTVAGQAINPAIVVEIQDQYGNVVNSNASVTLAIGTNAGGGTLSGSLTVSAVAGVATFSNVRLSNAASGYTLSASSTGLTGATSSTFTITP